LYGSIFVQICAVGSRRRTFDALFLQQSAFWLFKVIQVDDFDTKRKRIHDFLLVINNILHRFRDTATYWLKLPIFHIPLSFGALNPYVPFGISGLN